MKNNLFDLYSLEQLCKSGSVEQEVYLSTFFPFSTNKMDSINLIFLKWVLMDGAFVKINVMRQTAFHAFWFFLTEKIFSSRLLFASHACRYVSPFHPVCTINQSPDRVIVSVIFGRREIEINFQFEKRAEIYPYTSKCSSSFLQK